MSTELLEIGGTTPPDEECAQVGQPDYHERARKEAHAYIAQLVRAYSQDTGKPWPEGCCLRVKSNPHDFGSYLSVVARFDEADEEASSAAYWCEGRGPTDWDETSLAELCLPSRVPRLLWTCACCSVEVWTRGGEFSYRRPFGSKAAAWYGSHPFRDEEASAEPAHTFSWGPVCEYCHGTCGCCGADICTATSDLDPYTDGWSATPAEYISGMNYKQYCITCIESQCLVCGRFENEHRQDCDCRVCPDCREKSPEGASECKSCRFSFDPPEPSDDEAPGEADGSD